MLIIITIQKLSTAYSITIFVKIFLERASQRQAALTERKRKLLESLKTQIDQDQKV